MTGEISPEVQAEYDRVSKLLDAELERCNPVTKWIALHVILPKHRNGVGRGVNWITGVCFRILQKI